METNCRKMRGNAQIEGCSQANFSGALPTSEQSTRCATRHLQTAEAFLMWVLSHSLAQYDVSKEKQNGKQLRERPVE